MRKNKHKKPTNSFRLPKQIVICDSIWKIKRIRFKNNDCHVTWGEVDPNNKTISLQKGMKGRLLLETLYHELAHIFYSYYINIGLPDETFANAMASFIYSINKQLSLNKK